MTHSHISTVRLNQHEEEVYGSRDHTDRPGDAVAGTTGGDTPAIKSSIPSRPLADRHHVEEALACDGDHPAMR